MLSLCLLSAISLIDGGKINIKVEELGPEVVEILEFVFGILKNKRTTIFKGKEYCVGLFAHERGLAFPKRGNVICEERNYNGEPIPRDGTWYEMKDGTKCGKEITFYPGREAIYDEREYVDGKQNGKKTKWSECGAKIYECGYKDGKKHGKEILWYRNGQLKREVLFENGECYADKVITFRSDGRKIRRTCKENGIVRTCRWTFGGKKKLQSYEWIAPCYRIHIGFVDDIPRDGCEKCFQSPVCYG